MGSELSGRVPGWFVLSRFTRTTDSNEANLTLETVKADLSARLSLPRKRVHEECGPTPQIPVLTNPKKISAGTRLVAEDDPVAAKLIKDVAGSNA